MRSAKHPACAGGWRTCCVGVGLNLDFCVRRAGPAANQANEPRGLPMTIRRRDIAAVGVAAATLAAVTVPARAQNKAESTWDQIKKNGKVRMGIFDYPPYFLRDKASGEWVGAMVEMAKDIAKELDTKLEMVEVGGFGEAVLSLQANKVDMNFGLQATPKRATAIDFAGPIYWIEWVTVNNPKFSGKNWE